MGKNIEKVDYKGYLSILGKVCARLSFICLQEKIRGRLSLFQPLWRIHASIEAFLHPDLNGHLKRQDVRLCASINFVFTRSIKEEKEIWFNDFFSILWDNGQIMLWDNKGED